MFNNNTGDNGYGIMDTPARPTLLGRYIRNLTQYPSGQFVSLLSKQGKLLVLRDAVDGYTMLMQKSNAKYELVIWGEAFASKMPSTITINLGATYPVKVYDIMQSPTPNREPGRVTSVQLQLTDHAMIVEF
jgi:hypothetical protein